MEDVSNTLQQMQEKEENLTEDFHGVVGKGWRVCFLNVVLKFSSVSNQEWVDWFSACFSKFNFFFFMFCAFCETYFWASHALVPKAVALLIKSRGMFGHTQVQSCILYILWLSPKSDTNCNHRLNLQSNCVFFRCFMTFYYVSSSFILVTF